MAGGQIWGLDGEGLSLVDSGSCRGGPGDGGGRSGREARSARQRRGHRGTGGSLSRPTETVGFAHARRGRHLDKDAPEAMSRRVWKTKQRHRPGGTGPASRVRSTGVADAHAEAARPKASNRRHRGSARSRARIGSMMPEFGGEFDPGSGSTLAACLMHASRTGVPSGVSRGGRVRNTWAICPEVGDSLRKRGVIPHELRCRVGQLRKGLRAALGGACGRLACWWGNGLPRPRSVAGLRG